jgi:dethiobiotin synthetase
MLRLKYIWTKRCQRHNFQLRRNLTNYAALPVNADDFAVMIFGSGTDVGKTMISAGIATAALKSARKVCYIKPVQTGEMDEYFIQFYTNPRAINDIFVRTLFHWKVSASPQTTPKKDNSLISDAELLNSLQREMKAFSDSEEVGKLSTKRKKAFTIIETSGGVLSPGNLYLISPFMFNFPSQIRP